jgi:Flp pilus assembly secretin CpaC
VETSVAQIQPPSTLTVTKSQHLRIALPADILRVAVGDPDILTAEPIGTRELLALGKGSGRTTMIVWFRNGNVQEYLVTVQRDLSILQSALHRIHPNIEAEIAPDREAVILTGTVPTFTYSQAAETLTRNYLEAGPALQGGRLFLGAEPAQGPPQAAPQPPQPGAGAPNTPGAAGLAPAQPAQQPSLQLQGPIIAPPSTTVINLLQLEIFPPTPEEKIRDAIQGIGGGNVTIRRILKGPVRDDSRDVLVLEGSVPNQIALVRILSLASQIFVGQTATEDDIRVIADESGGLAGANQITAGGSSVSAGFGGGGTVPGIGTGGSANLQNQVQKNIARAKAIEVGKGRLISFLKVNDLPQVRVAVRIYEISRSRLRSFTPNFAAIVSDFQQPGLLSAPNGPGRAVGASTTADTGTRTIFQNILAFLGGTAANELQLTSGHFAIDAVLTYLERVGIARSLSTPALTVLSGEQAIFQVGGEVPVQEAFIPFGGSTTGTVTGSTASLSTFITTTFVSFGVQLNIRPLVGDEDMITLDIQPRVVQPNTELTLSIRASTGTNPTTTAFLTRALRTSARLQDGQALLIAGLLTRDTNNNQASTPGFRSVPGLGWLFRDYSKVDDSTELVLVINPSVLRDPIPGIQLWQYPDSDELLCGFTKPPCGQQRISTDRTTP